MSEEYRLNITRDQFVKMSTEERERLPHDVRQRFIEEDPGLKAMRERMEEAHKAEAARDLERQEGERLHAEHLQKARAERETLPYARTVYQNEAGSAYMSGHKAGSRYAWKCAGMEGDPPGWGPLEDEEDFDPAADEDLEALHARLEEVDIMPELLSRLEWKVTKEAWTIWAAFADFTREELELEPEKVVKVLFTPPLAGIEDLKRRKERLDIEPNEERSEEIGEALLETWERYRREAKRLSK